MPPTQIPLDQLRELPQTTHEVIPIAYLDEMGHMNIQYYVHIFNNAAWGMFAWFGLTMDKLQTVDGGMFALEQHIRYLAEVHAGESIVVHSRLLGLSKKRLHFMHFMINESTNKLAATFEVLASYANLEARRTAPFPGHFADDITARLRKHQALTWEAPVCGVLSP